MTGTSSLRQLIIYFDVSSRRRRIEKLGTKKGRGIKEGGGRRRGKERKRERDREREREGGKMKRRQ